MKKLILVTALILGMGAVSFAQNYVKEGNTYSYEITSKSKQSSEEQTKFTWKDSKGVEYPIYIGKTGSCYVKMISKKTGAEYKKYLGAEISADICKQLGREYQSKK